ncbi:MAG: hypothetical protein ACE5JR_08185 [Gemmatimonadota bacterium]
MPRPFELGEEGRCRICRNVVPEHTLDARVWCEACREELRRKVAVGQHAVAVLVTAPFAAWIAIEGVKGFLPRYAWLLPLAAAYYLGLRIGRETLRGVLTALRSRRRDIEGCAANQEREP